MRIPPFITSLSAACLLGLCAEAHACDAVTLYPRSWNDSCEGTVIPDEIFLTGSVSASGGQMVRNREDLKRKMEEIKRIAASNGGELVLKDLTRNFAEAAPNGYGAIPGAPTKAFIATQSFEIVLRKSADIDALIDKLSDLSTVSFGRSAGINDGRIKPFVRYRAQDAVGQLDRLVEACRLKAIAQACRTASEGSQVCAADLAKSATIMNFNLTSQAISNEYGQFTPINLYYPGQTSQISTLELNGDITLQLSGSITVQAAATPPASSSGQ